MVIWDYRLNRWRVRTASHDLSRISGAMLAGSGLYLDVYWIPALLRHDGTTPGTDPLSAVSAAISTWIGAHPNHGRGRRCPVGDQGAVRTVRAMTHSSCNGTPEDRQASIAR